MTAYLLDFRLNAPISAVLIFVSTPPEAISYMLETLHTAILIYMTVLMMKLQKKLLKMFVIFLKTFLRIVLSVLGHMKRAAGFIEKVFRELRMKNMIGLTFLFGRVYIERKK